MKTLEHKFVEFVPEELQEGFIYISIRYKTASHLCACGCGTRVVTPITPKDWKVTFDGKTISLSPSIGNWNFPCKSHYYITKNVIEESYGWDEHMSRLKGNKASWWDWG
jgi:hypothetical protein